MCHMLQLSPECCGSREELEREKEEIYVLEIDGELVGSVAIYDNEIDDLVVKGLSGDRVRGSIVTVCCFLPAK